MQLSSRKCDHSNIEAACRHCISTRADIIERNLGCSTCGGDGVLPGDCGAGPCMDCGYLCKDCEGTGSVHVKRFLRIMKRYFRTRHVLSVKIAWLQEDHVVPTFCIVLTHAGVLPSEKTKKLLRNTGFVIAYFHASSGALERSQTIFNIV